MQNQYYYSPTTSSPEQENPYIQTSPYSQAYQVSYQNIPTSNLSHHQDISSNYLCVNNRSGRIVDSNPYNNINNPEINPYSDIENVDSNPCINIYNVDSNPYSGLNYQQDLPPYNEPPSYASNILPPFPGNLIMQKFPSSQEYNYPTTELEEENLEEENLENENLRAEVDDKEERFGPEKTSRDCKFFCTITSKDNEIIKNRISRKQTYDSYRMKENHFQLTSQTRKENWIELSLENFKKIDDVDEPVVSISNGWIELPLMKEFGKFNKNFVNCIDLLQSEHNIIGWKKSRGDGNCYYRAVISRYLEIISGCNSEVCNLNHFITILNESRRFINNIPGLESSYLYAIDNIITILSKLIENNKEDMTNNFRSILSYLQDKNFDIDLVRVARILTYLSLIKSQSDYQDFGIDIHEVACLILTMGEEAEGFVLMLLPLILSIQVVQYNLFDQVIVEKFPNEIEKKIKVNIVRRKGHYDILYSNFEIESELYDFQTGTYHFLSYGTIR